MYLSLSSEHNSTSEPPASSRKRPRPKPAALSAIEPALADLGLAIEQVPLSRIKVYERNARTHSQRQITQLAASIRTFGFVSPIVLDQSNTIIAGHGRLQAAQELNLSSVPAVHVTHLSDAMVRALRIADNRLAELAGWDDDLLRLELGELSTIELDFSLDVTGFSTGEIDVLLDGKPTPQAADPADEVMEPEALAVSRLGDLWQLGDHRLICGSSLEPAVFDALLEGEPVRTVFTDPPYNVAVSGHVCGLGKVQHREFAMASGEMTVDQFTSFLSTVVANMAAHVVDGGLLYCCMDWRHISQLQAAADAARLALINLCVWAKDNGGMGSLYRSQHELVFVYKKGMAPHQNFVELGRHGRYRTNVWSYPGVNTTKAGRMEELAMHPTVKPVGLVADAIRDCTRRGELVLDAFSGSGTTIIAAERSGRRAAAIELDPVYVDTAIRRWERLTGKSATLVSTGKSFAEMATLRLEGVGHA
ncbi:site-specific DNA-methyltransferase [Mesorhizobium sp. RP14(2022)]|uniref:Methyltransferase n=1 Tax=Mesorhizobium liriopis TaxID=2953882 RepID=A0ABT1C8J6_9HYPH|nr:DNA methyltransferase [Mesorhizobium liriopis]MCO6050510.1 site-specific DNA-methyltransferase [Mesorhizobium liriopis]